MVEEVLWEAKTQYGQLNIDLKLNISELMQRLLGGAFLSLFRGMDAGFRIELNDCV